MKQTFYGALAILAILVTSCGGLKKSADADVAEKNLIGEKKWQLIELDGKPITGEVNGKMPYLNFLPNESRYSATGGCNTMNGEYKFTGNRKIEFTRGISTLMACEDMESDRALAGVFEKTKKYSLENDVLSFYEGGKNALAKFKAIEAGANLVGTWELDYISGAEESINQLFPQKKPTMIFQEDLKEVSGKGGCNRYSSQVEVAGKKISFSGALATKMACEGTGEPLFFQSLEKVNGYNVQDDHLTMLVGDVAIMRFKRGK